MEVPGANGTTVVKYAQEPCYPVRFSVERVCVVRGYRCYEVNVQFPKTQTGFQKRYRAYYREDKGNLIRVTDISVRTDGTVVAGDGLAEDFSVESALPIGPPQVPKMYEMLFVLPFSEGLGATREIPADRGWRSYVRQDREATAEGVTYRVTIEDVPQSPALPHKEHTITQTWKPGMPWWTKMEVFEDGELRDRAELVPLGTEGDFKEWYDMMAR